MGQQYVSLLRFSWVTTLIICCCFSSFDGGFRATSSVSSLRSFRTHAWNLHFLIASRFPSQWECLHFQIRISIVFTISTWPRTMFSFGWVMKWLVGMFQEPEDWTVLSTGPAACSPEIDLLGKLLQCHVCYHNRNLLIFTYQHVFYPSGWAQYSFQFNPFALASCLVIGWFTLQNMHFLLPLESQWSR
jgi:hypothetical protein